MNPPDTTWSTVSEEMANSCPSISHAAITTDKSTCDVCVVGGGIAGLTAAYVLACSGRTVVVLDAADIGAGETVRSTAHLVTALDDRFSTIERLHGRTAARLAAESHAAAIDFIEHLVDAQHISCDFTRLDGYLVSATGNVQALVSEAESARRAGLSVDLVEAIPGIGLWPAGGLRFPRQARCDPAAYLAGLWRCCAEAGVRKQSQTRVVSVTEGDHVTIESADGTRLQADAVVIATNVPCHERIILQTKLESYRTYVVAFRIDRELFPDVLLWDDAEPYHYVRIAADAEGAVLLVGGEDHKTGQGPTKPMQPYVDLEQWARQHFPALGARVHAWSGQISEPVDGLAFIGLDPGARKVYVITGDSGNGMTHGTIGGMLVADLIRGVSNPWQEIYRPGRITLGATAEFSGHNANVLRQYGDWLTRGDYLAASDIPCGQGAIIRNGMQLQAVYRRSDGSCHTCSAVCPHLGGIVRWNAEESTWDCPCHGSRFSATGTMLHGPANSDLAPVVKPQSNLGSESALLA